MLPTVSFRTMRFVSAMVVLVCAVMLVTPLSLPAAVSPDRAVVSALIFYGVTVGAYGLLPFVRRGDIFMAAMWLVLAVGVAPCVEGEELSPLHMFADRARNRRDPPRGAVANQLRQIFFRLPAQMLRQFGDDGRELGVAVDLHVLHDRGLATLDERRQRIRRHRKRHVELLRVGFAERAQIAVRLHDERQHDRRRRQSRGLARVRGEALASPRFAGEQMIDGSDKGLGGEGH